MTVGAKTILIVDDDPDVRLFLQFVLTKRGFRILQAPNGAKALEILGEQRPDLIMTDVMMPVLDGYGLIAAVRAMSSLSGLPILMLTGKDEEEGAGQPVKPDFYLKKPFSAGDVMARIDALLPPA